MEQRTTNGFGGRTEGSSLDEPAEMSFPRGEQISVFAGPRFPLQPPLLLHQYFDHLLQSSDNSLTTTALVTRTPNGKSVREFSYAQLQDLSHLIAQRFLHKLHHHHHRHPKEHDDVPYIAFCAPKSPELCIAVLGALKAGCAYLPIDYDWPAERFRYVLNDARPSVIVVDDEVFRHQAVLDQYCDEHKARKVEITHELFHRLGGDDEKATHKKLPENVEPHHTALVLYTSGTTGEPKGVKLPHCGLMNALQFRLRRFPYFDDEEGLLKTVMTFSDSALEMFETWFNLRPLIVMPKEDLLDIPKFVRFLENNRVYRMIIVPSLLAGMLDVLEDEPQRQFAGPMWLMSIDGEPCTAQLAERFFRHFPHTKLANFYGQTECCADLCYEWWNDLASFNSTRSSDGLVSIGRLIDNLNAYILDQNLQPTPVGTPGELYISGPSVCESYIGTKLGKFLLNNLLPNATEANHNEQNAFDDHRTLLKTGDVCLYDPKQNRMYLQGRTDDMVKIAGQKVHLIEVEKAMQQIPNVIETAVISIVRLGQVKLVGFVRFQNTNTDSAAIEEDVLLLRKAQQVLSRLLPTYAQPQLVVHQHAPLPRTESGKLAKRRLLDYYQSKCENLTENDSATALGILATSIGVPQSTIDPQKTFVENGGSSLKLLPAVLALKNAGFNIELNDFLSARNLQEISTLCEKTNSKQKLANGHRKPEAPRCSFEVVQKPLSELDRTEVVDLVSDSFGNFQDLAMYGEITSKEMRPLIEHFYPFWIEDGTSFALVRADDGCVVAVSASIDNTTQISESAADYMGAKFHQYVHEMLSSLDKMLEPHLPKGRGKVMHAMMDAILPAVGAADKVALMYKLFMAEIEIARERKFECIMAETASPLTEQLAHDFITHKVYGKVKPKEFVTSDGRMPWANYPDNHYVYGDVLWLNERQDK